MIFLLLNLQFMYTIFLCRIEGIFLIFMIFLKLFIDFLISCRKFLYLFSDRSHICL
jgi:hypothetical protein